jgi:hypothetical protein
VMIASTAVNISRPCIGIVLANAYRGTYCWDLSIYTACSAAFSLRLYKLSTYQVTDLVGRGHTCLSESDLGRSHLDTASIEEDP